MKKTWTNTVELSRLVHQELLREDEGDDEMTLERVNRVVRAVLRRVPRL